MFEDTKQWFTIEEAAEYVGASERWVIGWYKAGRIPYSKRGRRVLFERAHLDALITSQRVQVVQ
jgi:excisionase family DNA binding protein